MAPSARDAARCPVALELAANETRAVSRLIATIPQPTTKPGNIARLIGHMQFLARRYDSGQVIRLEINGQQITAVEPVRADVPAAVSCPWVSPGWWDIQVNGYAGQEFSSTSLRAEKVIEVGRAMFEFGATRFCPTVTTQNHETLVHALRTIAAACETDPLLARQVPGVHLEGPYISREDGPRGAHPKDHCRPPDANHFFQLQEAAGGRIRLVTISPEYDDASAFIEQVTDSGVVVSIGHTAADSIQIRRAVDAGARLSTHLGNGSHPVIRRHPNYIWDQLADDRLMASLIADGHHLPAAVLKTFIRAKTPARCILVSDLSGQAGQPPGRYHSEFCEVEILPSGKLVIAGQRNLYAGASLPLATGVGNVMRFAGVDLAGAIDMVVGHPARLLGFEPGGLSVGDPADLVLFDLLPADEAPAEEMVQLRTVLFAGQVVAGRI